MRRGRRVKSLGIYVKRVMYERIVVPTVLYGAETWGAECQRKKKIECNERMQLKCLRSICGVTVEDRIKNE